jgi:hypothetical protein
VESNHAKTKIEYRNVEVEEIGSMMIEKSAFVGVNIDGGW